MKQTFFSLSSYFKALGRADRKILCQLELLRFIQTPFQVTQSEVNKIMAREREREEEEERNAVMSVEIHYRWLS